MAIIPDGQGGFVDEDTGQPAILNPPAPNAAVVPPPVAPPAAVAPGVTPPIIVPPGMNQVQQQTVTDTPESIVTTTSGKQLAPGAQDLYDQKAKLIDDQAEIQKKQFQVNKEAADAALKQAEKDTEITNAKAVGLTTIDNTYKTILEDKQKSLDEANEKYKSMEFKDFWESKSTGAKVLAAISVGLGTLGAALTHGNNDAATIIQNAIKNDFERQKAAIDKQFQTVGMSRQELQDAKAQRQFLLDQLTMKQAAALEASATLYKQKMAAQGVSKADIDNDTQVNAIQQASINLKLEPLIRTEKEVSEAVTAAKKIIQTDTKGVLPEVPEAQKELQKAEGKALGEWGAKGGSRGDINQLKAAKAKLQKLDIGKGSQILGALEPLPGGETARKLLSKDEIAVQQAIATVQTKFLKELFGGNVSDSEREVFLQLQYDPSLSKEQNIEKLDRAIENAEAAQKRNMERYKAVKAGQSIPDNIDNADEAPKQTITPEQARAELERRAKAPKQ